MHWPWLKNWRLPTTGPLSLSSLSYSLIVLRKSQSVSPLESPPPYGIGTGSAQSAQATAAGTAAKAGKL